MLYYIFSGRFRGGRAREPALPFIFGRRTDAVMVLLISENGTLVLWRVLNFDRSVVKPALQNTQNDCHKWLSGRSTVH